MSVRKAGKEQDAKKCRELADRIEELLERHDTSAIAKDLAGALSNAVVKEQDAKKCEALAERIRVLLKRHDAPEIAGNVAWTIYLATGSRQEPKEREALAGRIGELLGRRNMPEIAVRTGELLRHYTVELAMQPVQLKNIDAGTPVWKRIWPLSKRGKES